jgi:hypothetical protein
MRRTKDMKQKFAAMGEQKIRNLCNMTDDLSLLDQIKAEILPKIQKDLLEGKSAAEILEKYQSFAAARLVSNLVTEADSGKSNMAAKEVLDRTLGKSVEKRETTHKYADLTDDELDALVSSRAKK